MHQQFADAAAGGFVMGSPSHLTSPHGQLSALGSYGMPMIPHFSVAGFDQQLTAMQHLNQALAVQPHAEGALPPDVGPEQPTLLLWQERQQQQLQQQQQHYMQQQLSAASGGGGDGAAPPAAPHPAPASADAINGVGAAQALI